MTGRKMSRAHAQGLADLIEGRRVNGRWVAFTSIELGRCKIEYREELAPNRYEVTEGTAYRRNLYTLTDALQHVAALDPELDLDALICAKDAGAQTRIAKPSKQDDLYHGDKSTDDASRRAATNIPADNDSDDMPHCEWCGKKVTDDMTAEFAPLCSARCRDEVRGWNKISDEGSSHFPDRIDSEAEARSADNFLSALYHLPRLAKFKPEEIATQTIEALIDKHGLTVVLDFLGDVCRTKQAYIQETWQDIELAKRWNAAAIHVEHCSNIVEMIGL